MNYKQLYAKRKYYAEKLKQICPRISNTSGIYFYIREEEEKKFAYIGKAKHLLDRNIQHLMGYKQRIDISLKKRGFKKDNGTGWELYVLYVPEDRLDFEERTYIEKYIELGCELYNIESGGTVGKTLINERKPAKTYRDGLKQGYENARKEIKKLFDKNLVFSVNGKTNKNKEKSLEKFKNFLK